MNYFISQKTLFIVCSYIIGKNKICFGETLNTKKSGFWIDESMWSVDCGLQLKRIY